MHPSCRLPGCPRRRASRRTPYCAGHQATLNRYGHPAGHPIRPTELEPYRRLVVSLYDRFPGHPGLAAGETILADLLRLSQSNLRDREMADHALRLLSHGVTPRELLERIGAVFLYARDHPRRLPDDNRLNFALARAVLYARPLRRVQAARGYWRSTRPTAATCAALGLFIRTKLALLFHQAALYFEQRHQREQELANAMRAPFTTEGPQQVTT